jgi:protein SCO1/2
MAAATLSSLRSHILAVLLCGLLGTQLLIADARAEGVPALDAAAALERSQAAIGGVAFEAILLDSNEQARRLSEFRGKPALVSFVYSGCFEVCPTSSRALSRAVAAMRERFGPNQFNVLTIGFNQPTDSPQAMRNFAARLGIRDRNWHFLSPRKEDVAALERAFGFEHVATPMGFDHTLQVSILDAAGVLREQVYGDAFHADALGEPLRLLIGGDLLVRPPGNWRDLLERIRILCSVYDPVTGRYHTDFSLYLELAGGITFILAMFWFVLHERRLRRAAAARQRRPQASIAAMEPPGHSA